MIAHCQRCGAARVLETLHDPYRYADTQIIINCALYYGFCARCMAQVSSILEHWIAGEPVTIGDDAGTTTYRVLDGQTTVEEVFTCTPAR